MECFLIELCNILCIQHVISLFYIHCICEGKKNILYSINWQIKAFFPFNCIQRKTATSKKMRQFNPMQYTLEIKCIQKVHRMKKMRHGKRARKRKEKKRVQPNWMWYDATALHRAHRIKSRPVAVLPHMKCIFDVKLFCSTINWIPWIGWQLLVRLLAFASVFNSRFRMAFSCDASDSS